MAALRGGDVIRGRYELVGVLGKGGMGIVFEAVHLGLAKRVALKLVLPDQLLDPDSVLRFGREARAVAQLTSEHVARVIDADHTEDGTPFIVFEFLEGRDLAAELAARGALSIREGVNLVLQICAALAEAHERGIIHRDLKPSNLFLVDGSPRCLKVLDFGLSKLLTEVSDATASSMVMGTPNYMSPEQLLSSKNVDARTDIWSLGVVLYRLLSNAYPFEGDSTAALGVAIATKEPIPLSKRRAGVPPALDALIGRALAKDRTQRFSSVRELASALRPFASSGAPSNAKKPTAAADATPLADATTRAPTTRAATASAVLQRLPHVKWILPSILLAMLVVIELLRLRTPADPERPTTTRDAPAPVPASPRSTVERTRATIRCTPNKSSYETGDDFSVEVRAVPAPIVAAPLHVTLTLRGPDGTRSQRQVVNPCGSDPLCNRVAFTASRFEWKDFYGARASLLTKPGRYEVTGTVSDASLTVEGCGFDVVASRFDSLTVPSHVGGYRLANKRKAVWTGPFDLLTINYESEALGPSSQRAAMVVQLAILSSAAAAMATYDKTPMLFERWGAVVADAPPGVELMERTVYGQKNLIAAWPSGDKIIQMSGRDDMRAVMSEYLRLYPSSGLRPTSGASASEESREDCFGHGPCKPGFQCRGLPINACVMTGKF